MGKKKQVSEDDSAGHLPSHYVAIGASAGGLEAIETFFSNMQPVSGRARHRASSSRLLRFTVMV